MEEIGNPPIEDQIGNLWTKEILNVSIVRKKVTLNLSVGLNLRIKLTIGISDS